MASHCKTSTNECQRETTTLRQPAVHGVCTHLRDRLYRMQLWQFEVLEQFKNPFCIEDSAKTETYNTGIPHGASICAIMYDFSSAQFSVLRVLHSISLAVANKWVKYIICRNSIKFIFSIPDIPLAIESVLYTPDDPFFPVCLWWKLSLNTQYSLPSVRSCILQCLPHSSVWSAASPHPLRSRIKCKHTIWIVAFPNVQSEINAIYKQSEIIEQANIWSTASTSLPTQFYSGEEPELNRTTTPPTDIAWRLNTLHRVTIRNILHFQCACAANIPFATRLNNQCAIILYNHAWAIQSIILNIYRSSTTTRSDIMWN